MQTYTFYFLDRRDVIQGFEFEECPDDAEAQRRARALLSTRPERRAVEIWTDSDRIAVLP